jgi:hypothetical protein
MTGTGTVKGKNILRDPRVMLSIDDERPPFAFVLVEGTSVPTELSPAELLPGSTRIAGRYMSAAQADAYGRRAMQLRESFWFGLALGRLSLNKMLPTSGSIAPDPRDEKHPVLLPVGERAHSRLHNDMVLPRIIAQERNYLDRA